MKTHLRVARATDHLEEIVRFYRDGLGFEVVGEFYDHEGFDGVMLGHAGFPYHFEFTRERGVNAGRALLWRVVAMLTAMALRIKEPGAVAGAVAEAGQRFG